MDIWSNLPPLFAGWMVGMFVFSGVTSLIRVARETLKQPARGSGLGARVALMVMTALASSGLWTLVVFAGVFIVLRVQSWAPLFYAGTVASTLFAGLLVSYAVRRNRRLHQAGVQIKSVPRGTREFIKASASQTAGPVNATYTFELSLDRVNEFKQESKRVLAKLSLQIESEIVDVINWDSKLAFVTLYIDLETKCTAIVGTRRHGSDEWQKVASHLEPLLVCYGTMVEAHVLPALGAVDSGRATSEAIQVKVPIDFRGFSHGAAQSTPTA